MKKKCLFIVSVLVMALVVAGCYSTPMVYDSSVPLEESSTLEIGNGTVTGFNGKNTFWDTKAVIIPAGTHTLTIRNSEERGTSIEYGQVTMTYTFLPGHTYAVFAPIEGGRIIGTIIDKVKFSEDLVPDPSSPDASRIEGKWKITDGKTTNEFTFAKNEYARFINGNYFSRGFFQIGGNSVSMTVGAFYNSKKDTWSVMTMPLSGGNLTYNGTSWFLGKYELQKVE